MRASELLLYLFLIFGVLLFNMVMRLLSRRSQQQGPDEQPAPPEAAPRRVPTRAAIPPEELWGRLPEAVQPPPAVPARRAAAPPISPRRHISALLGSRQDVRRGVVLMTVLGPCRALAPYDERRTDRPL